MAGNLRTRTRSALPELGPVPDVTGLTVREARLAIRLAALVPVVNRGDPIDPSGMVWGQEPGAGQTPESGAAVGLRTCWPADQVVSLYQNRLEGTGVILCCGRDQSGRSAPRSF